MLVAVVHFLRAIEGTEVVLVLVLVALLLPGRQIVVLGAGRVRRDGADEVELVYPVGSALLEDDDGVVCCLGRQRGALFQLMPLFVAEALVVSEVRDLSLGPLTRLDWGVPIVVPIVRGGQVECGIHDSNCLDLDDRRRWL